MITINLWAKEGYLSTPDGGSIYFWGFSTAADSPAQLPGPHMILKQDEAVTVNLTNTLPEPVSVFFPGQSSVTSGGKPVQPQYEFGGRLLSFTNHALPGDVVEGCNGDGSCCISEGCLGEMPTASLLTSNLRPPTSIFKVDLHAVMSAQQMIKTSVESG